MLRTPSTIHKIETMADGGLKLVIYTQELTAEDMANLMNLKNSLGWMVFAPAEESIREEDIPKEEIERQEKSPSQRLRAVIYRVWEKEMVGAKKMDFEVYYRVRMERIIEQFKDKLD